MGSLEGHPEGPQAGINYLIAQRYIGMLPDLAKNGDRVFVPIEGTALLGSLGGMRDLFGPGAMGAVDAAGPSSSN